MTAEQTNDAVASSLSNAGLDIGTAEICVFCNKGFIGPPRYRIACRECGGTGRANRFCTNVGAGASPFRI